LKPALIAALCILLFVPSASGFAWVQERSAGGQHALLDGTPNMALTVNATAPGTVNESASTSHISFDITLHLTPAAFQTAQGTWEIRWKTGNTLLCNDQADAPAGTAARNWPTWQGDCYLPDYVSGQQTVYLNFTSFTNARAFVSMRLVQNEVMEMDSLNIETALDPWLTFLILAGLLVIGFSIRNPLLIFIAILATLTAAVGAPLGPGALAVYAIAAILFTLARERLFPGRKKAKKGDSTS